MHTGYAGDYVDNQIIVEVQKKYNGAQITKGHGTPLEGTVLIRIYFHS